jgi:hypothetical protein
MYICQSKPNEVHHNLETNGANVAWSIVQARREELLSNFVKWKTANLDLRCTYLPGAGAEPVAGLYFGLSGFSRRSWGATLGTGLALSIHAV